MSRTHLGVVCSLGSEVICRVAQEFLLCGAPIAVSGVGALKEVLRSKSFGIHYGNLSLSDSADLIREQLYRGWQETAETRKKRAELSREHFSFERMGCDLDKVFSPMIRSESSDVLGGERTN